jgi:acetoin utilization deacetylase AcuC-like enzyme
MQESTTTPTIPFKRVTKDTIRGSFPITKVVYDTYEATDTASKRAVLIREYLMKVADSDKFPIRFIENIKPIGDSDLSQLKVHDENYVDFLTRAYIDAEKHKDNDWFKDRKLVPYHFVRGAATDSLIDRLRKDHLYKLSGYYCNDDITPIISSTCVHAFRSAENSRYAADLIVQRDRDHSPIRQVYVLNSSPGHHAMRAGYGGYCFLNNAAIAAARIHQLTDAPVAILDLDYHAGDGTQEIFYEDSKILTVSIHMNPEHDYPTYAGYPEEKGCGAGANKNVNILVEPNSPIPYTEHLKKAFSHIAQHNTQYLVVAFGADTYIRDGDPSNKAGMNLQVIDYIQIGAVIRSWGLPMVITQEGGYALDPEIEQHDSGVAPVPRIVRHFLFGC